MKKLDLKKIVEAMKPVKDAKAKPESPIISRVKSGGVRVRDMRQEAIDGGSHGAHEYFKDIKE